MSQPDDRYRFTLTPAGAGVLSLFFPGLVIAAVLRQPLLVAVSIGSGIALVINAVAARWLVGGLTVTAAGPPISTVGHPYPVHLTVEGARRVECIVAVDNAVQPWIVAIAPGQGEIQVRAERRGVVDQIGTKVQTTAPLGLIACVRSSLSQQLRPIYVGPRRVPVPAGLVNQGTSHGPSSSPGEDPLGVRPYRAGDSQRDVHWAAVARTGTMIVRDRGQEPEQRIVEVFVDASKPGTDGDDLLGRVRTVVEDLLAAGWLVDLMVPGDGEGSRAEPTRPLSNRVTSPEDICRRLALATLGPASRSLRGTEVMMKLVVDAEGQQWHSPS